MKEKDNEEKQYLSEDQDLLDELEKIGPMSTGTALSEQQHKTGVIQIKSALRSRKTMVDLDKSNKKYSLILLFFAFIQFVVAGLQLILQIKIFPDQVFAFIIGVIFLVIVYLLSRFFDKKIDKN